MRDQFFFTVDPFRAIYYTMSNLPQDGEIQIILDRAYIYSAAEDTWYPAPTAWDHCANTIVMWIAVIVTTALIVYSLFLTLLEILS